MRELERRVILSVLDRKWREHLYEMDYLQEGIGLRAMAQRDPLVEYQREGYDMFAAMMDAIKEESVGYLFHLEVQVGAESEGESPQAEPAEQAEPEHAQPAISARGLDRPSRPAHLEYTAPTVDGEGGVLHLDEDAHGGAAGADGGAWKDVPRNAPCPCGSGRKYKRCHGDPRVRAGAS
jgi:preprotein translocase subunit SecA